MCAPLASKSNRGASSMDGSRCIRFTTAGRLRDLHNTLWKHSKGAGRLT